jgi:hypothetical protein
MNSKSQHSTANEFLFRPRGFGRFPSAIFLALWLCAWAVGEGFAIFILGHGIWALLTDSPMFASSEALQLAPALAVGAFLLIWLTIWTIGGVMAMQEFWRLLWAKDRLVLDHDTLCRFRRRGPFKSTHSLSRNEIRRVFIRPSNSVLMVQLKETIFELTDLGTAAERSEAAQRLCAAMSLPDVDRSAVPAALPEDWQEVAGPHGERLLVPNLETRRKQAIVVAIVTGLVWSMLLLLAREAMSEPFVWIVALLLTILAAWLARQTLWMLRGRKEWRIESGSLLHQRRFAGEVTELFQARALELAVSHDSDGDPWYHLNAIELSPPTFAPADRTPEKIRIMYSIHDATEARSLGRWLARQAGIPLHDRVPGEADRRAEITRVMGELARSGKFGRFVVRLFRRSRRTRED